MNRHMSPKYMARYLDEFAFGSNHREMENAMFDLLSGLFDDLGKGCV